MEEALSILWTYARRQPIESNGKTIVATISQSIAAIRIIMRLEGWLQKSEKVKDKSEKPAAPAVATSVCRGERQFPRWCGLVARTSPLMQAYGSSPHKDVLVVTTYHPQSCHLPCQEVLSCFDKGAFRLPQPRKVGHQGLYIKADNKNCNQASKPRKVSLPYPYIAADLHKNTPLMEPPMIRHHVADDNYRDDGQRLISSRPPPF